MQYPVTAPPGRDSTAREESMPTAHPLDEVQPTQNMTHPGPVNLYPPCTRSRRSSCALPNSQITFSGMAVADPHYGEGHPCLSSAAPTPCRPGAVRPLEIPPSPPPATCASTPVPRTRLLLDARHPQRMPMVLRENMAEWTEARVAWRGTRPARLACMHKLSHPTKRTQYLIYSDDHTV